MAGDPHQPRHFDDLRTMWKAVVAMYGAGGATLFLTLPVREPDTSDHDAMAVMGLVLLAVGLILWRLGPRRDVVTITGMGGTLVVSAMVALAVPLGATPFFYLWPMLIAGYFLDRRQLVVSLALFYGGYAAGLALGREEHSKGVLFVGGASSFTVAALVLHNLRRRLDRVVEELHQAAVRDPLTGLLNRRGFEEAFEHDLERARRTGAPLSLVAIDIDFFKQVNDRFGHAVGDATLERVATVLLGERRAGDFVARTGGEEFTVVLNDADLDGALAYVQRVAAAPAMAEGAAGPIGLSAGIVQASAELGERRDLMLAADRLLYAAKAAGRGRAAIQGEPPRMEPLPRAAPAAAA